MTRSTQAAPLLIPLRASCWGNLHTSLPFWTSLCPCEQLGWILRRLCPPPSPLGSVTSVLLSGAPVFLELVLTLPGSAPGVPAKTEPQRRGGSEP